MGGRRASLHLFTFIYPLVRAKLGYTLNFTSPGHLEEPNNLGGLGGWCVDGCKDTLYSHYVAPSCKRGLARSSARLKIQDRAECGNIGLLYAN